MYSEQSGLQFHQAMWNNVSLLRYKMYDYNLIFTKLSDVKVSFYHKINKSRKKLP